MAKTLRTSGDYTIKAGDGYNSGSGTNSITLDSLNVTVNGNLTVGGTSSTISTTNTVIEDNIIELQTGISASTNDSGIIIERGSTGNNACIIWDESTDTFKLGTTTATGTDKSGGITVTAGALEVAAFTATTITATSFVTTGTAITIADNLISTGASNADIKIVPHGTGDVLLSALRVNGTTLDSSDSSKITLAEAVDVTGAASFGSSVSLDGSADLILNDNRIAYDSSGVVSFMDFTVTQFSTANQFVLSSVKSINMFLDSNSNDTGCAFRIYNNLNPDSSPTESAYIFKVAEDGNLYVTGDTSIIGATTIGGALTATSLTTNEIASNGSNADINIIPQGAGKVVINNLSIDGELGDITSDSSNMDITVTPHGTGDFRVDGHVGLKVQAGDAVADGDHAHIYAKDDTSSAEVYVRDEAGNVTKLSPHNREGEWEYFSRNVNTGKVVRINMEEMIKDIEKLTGKTYIKGE